MSERRAYVCDACYKAQNPLRIFVPPGAYAPKCPTHGKMRLEKNKPYMQSRGKSKTSNATAPESPQSEQAKSPG